MIVQKGAEQVVGGGDGVHVAGEVEVDVLHRDDLGVSAARRAALDAEHRPEGRLPQGDHRFFPDFRHGLPQTDGGGGFSFAGGGGIDGGDQNQFAVRPGIETCKKRVVKLGFIAPVQIQLFFPDAEFGRNIANRAQVCALGDFNVG